MGDKRLQTQAFTNNCVNEGIVIGRLRTVFGVKGWLKVQSYTQPLENIFEYSSWSLSLDVNMAGAITLEVEEHQAKGKDLVVKFKGLDDREEARRYAQHFVSVAAHELPVVADDEVYWHQLEGMTVYRIVAGCEPVFEQSELLGSVAYMMETGANDVLVVNTAEANTADRKQLMQPKQPKQLMLPYVLGYSILNVDLANRRILIDWQFD